MTTIKCVVWDLDGTIWDGVALEAQPGEVLNPIPEVLRAMEVLEERGIVNSLASRTDPSVGDMVWRHPQLARRFVAPQLGWGRKSDAIWRIADELGVRLDAFAFVDNSPFERADVAAALPDVLVLAPEELLELLDSPLFRPAVATAEARGRVDRYRQEQARRHAQRSFDSRAEFLEWCQMRLSLAPASLADVDRLAELSVRTHRLNSTGETLHREHVARLVTDARWFVPVARLTDRFGDYGLIGAAFVERSGKGRCEGDESAWCLRLLTISCRVAGRGVAVAFLRWIIGRARAAGATRVLAQVRRTDANLEVRVLFRQFGLQIVDAGEKAGANRALLGRMLTGPLPACPPWLHLVEGE